MKKSNADICKSNPKAESCDIVSYAQSLVDEEHAQNMANITVGKQKGFTKGTVEGVMEAFKEP